MIDQSAWTVRVDDRNNPNEFAIDIAIKPVKPVEYISVTLPKELTEYFLAHPDEWEEFLAEINETEDGEVSS